MAIWTRQPRSTWRWRWLGFVAGAARRRKVLLGSIWAGFVALVLALAVALPRTYEVRAVLVFKPSVALPVRSDAIRVAPTTATAGLVLRHENLEKLVRATGLLEAWGRSRTPLLAAKDALVARVRGPSTEQDRIDGFVDMLEERLAVRPEPGGTVTFELHWPDAELAQRLVAAALGSFLEMRREAEIGSLEKLVAILSAHEKVLQATLEEQLGRLARAGATTALPSGALPELRELRAARERHGRLERALEAIEADRHRRAAGLRSQLQESRGVYSDLHPVVVGLQQRIDALGYEGPEEARLRREEREAWALVQDLQVDAAGPGGVTDRPFLDPARGVARWSGARGGGARRGQGEAGDQAQATRARIEQLSIELETAKAAFPYRYVVVQPPEVPRGPVRPDPIPVTAVAVVYGGLLALFGVALAEARGGAVRESWQLEQAVGPRVPVVEVRL